MNVDEDFETVLRHQFQAQDPQLSPSPDLASRVLTGGIQAVGRRRVFLGIGTAAGVAVLVAAVAVAVNLTTSPGVGPGPAVRPSASESTEKLSPAVWADSLPRGEAPEVAYLAGTTVHLPNGAVAKLDGEDAGMVGQTVAGLIVLVEDTDDEGGFSSRYVLVHDDGTTFDMVTSTMTAGAAQEALVSPDGRFFTNGGPVIDKSTGLPVGEMPEAAQVLMSWTSVGIIYHARDHSYLWRLGGEPLSIEGNPGIYATGTDIGIRTNRAGCPEVVRIDSTGDVARAGKGCVPGLLSVSPDGTRGLTTDLRVVDIETGEASPLSDTPLGDLDGFTDVHWLDNDQLLVPVPAPTRDVKGAGGGFARVLRCSTTSLTCVSATGSTNVGDYRSVQLP